MMHECSLAAAPIPVFLRVRRLGAFDTLSDAASIASNIEYYSSP